MPTAIVQLESSAPYSQSRNYEMEVPRPAKMTAKEHEEKTWMNRMHVIDGEVVIPPMAFKNCLSEAAKYLGKQIPGKGKATYTKHFEAGVLVVDPVPIGIKAQDVKGVWYYLPSDGKRGGGKRVWKKYPEIPKWTGTVTFHIFDKAVTKEVFTEHLVEAGQFIGIGRFRPRNNGFFGRFSVKKVTWTE